MIEKGGRKFVIKNMDAKLQLLDGLYQEEEDPLATSYACYEKLCTRMLKISPKSDASQKFLDELVDDLFDYGFCTTNARCKSFISYMKSCLLLFPDKKKAREAFAFVVQNSPKTDRDYLNQFIKIIAENDLWVEFQVVLFEFYRGAHDDVLFQPYMRDVLAGFFVPAWIRRKK